MKKQLILCITVLLIGAILLTACNSAGGKEQGSTEQSSTQQPTTPDGEKIEYVVSILDYQGTPMNDVVVTLFQNGEQKGMKIAKNGLVTFNAEKGNYTFSISAPAGDYYYDESKCVLSGEIPQALVQLYGKTDKKSAEKLYAISPVTKDVEEYTAYGVTEGGTHVSLTPGDMAFFVFRPTREGVYKISFLSDKQVEIGYYGSPLTVATSAVSRVEIVDNAFELEVRAIHLGDTPETTTPYVIGFQSTDAADCVLTIDWLKKPDFDPVDAPWVTVKPAQEELDRIKAYLQSNPTPEKAVFKDLDVTDPSLTVVYNESDGFYHYNTADGPVVYFRIGTASPYLDAFTKVCETGHLGVHFYDTEGKFLRKESYNELMTAYLGVSTGTEQACPLNKQLAEILQNVGEYRGWWKTGTIFYLFANDLVFEDTAWLFACGYFE